MNDLQTLFEKVFTILSKDDFLKKPESILSYMKDVGFDKAYTNLMETMIKIDRRRFILSLTCPSSEIENNVQSMSGRCFIDKNVLLDVITILRSSIGHDSLQNNNQNNTKDLQKKANDANVWLPETKIIKHPTFGKCRKAIDRYIIYNCEMNQLLQVAPTIETVIIPQTITQINEYAFRYCRDLKKVIIPKTVKTIGHCAFLNCESLVDINLPPMLTEISNSLFCSCYSLTKIDIPKSVTKIGCHAFSGCNKILKIEIPSQVIEIGLGAFSNCCSLEEVTIPDLVTKIEPHTFSFCRSLVKAVIPKKVTRIGYHSFEGCTSLIEVDIPPLVTEIEVSAFENCSSLTKVTIPESVEIIQKNAFSGCMSLKEVYLPKNLKTIGHCAFFPCSVKSVHIGRNTEVQYDSFPGQTKMVYYD